jgi:murein L,D-transpeptidase YcbB/YkuD
MKRTSSLVPAVAAALLTSCGLAPVAGSDQSSSGSVAEAPLTLPARSVSAAPLPPIDVSDEIAAFYKDHGFRPLWVRRAGLTPSGRQLLDLIARAEERGLRPELFDLPLLRSAAAAAESGDPANVAKAELLLSSAYAAYVRALHVPRTDDFFFVDEELAPPPLKDREVLEAAAAAASLPKHLAAAARMNPLYEALAQALVQYRAGGGDAAGERLILANLERARLIPAEPARRYVIVDTAGSNLWMVEDGKVVDSMKVIVGKPGMATPEMAGLIRYATLNPYWNLPPDLAQERAKRVLKNGRGVIAAERLQILSDWSERPRVLNASEVNWRAVASGAQPLRMRQLPGGDNVMGDVKFMLPNRLGIYLHDTPNKSGFELAERRLSSGCVRVEDAARLSRWLFDGRQIAPQGNAPEQRVDLPEPVPVYMTYLTAVPRIGGGVVFRKDHYKRDAALLARLEDRARQRSA